LEQSAQQRQFALADETKILAVLQQQQIWFMAGIFAVGALLLLGASFGYSHSILAALKRLSTSADQIAAGNYSHRIAATTDKEIARLAVSFNHMTASVQERQEQVEQQRQTIEQRAAELEQTLAELRKTVDERDELNLTVRELASPVLPIAPGILVMPLIGVIDTERVALLNRVLLTAIERHNATMTIVDVTGVPIIDTQVARALIDAAKAARLLGSRTVLVGLRPELAQTLVGLGVSLTDMVTQADLQSGIRFALQNGLGRALSSRS
jgi:anti-anti-sigma regulatory factor/HAMP domain-containing protein